jgi:dTDP-4-amino-4,6-dideoxygalactose transaminase
VRLLFSTLHENLPAATKVADSVICLPMYADLERSDVERIINEIAEK